MHGLLASVNVGLPRDVHTPGGRVVRTAIWKDPVEGRVPVAGVNLRGDGQADRTVHGGPDKAVYAYGLEDAAWWAEQLGRPLGPGTFGENLSTEGLDVSGARIGDLWAVGSALFQVCQPRLPCFKLGLRLGDPRLVRAFGQADRPGAYLRIVEEGEVGAGDRIEVLSRAPHDVTVALVSRVVLHEPHRAAEVLPADRLAAGLREHVLELAARAR